MFGEAVSICYFLLVADWALMSLSHSSHWVLDPPSIGNLACLTLSPRALFKKLESV